MGIDSIRERASAISKSGYRFASDRALNIKGRMIYRQTAHTLADHARNAPGTVDADYRGEVGVLLINHGKAPFTIRRGERIAQMVIAPVVQAQLVQVASLSATDRGGGFGSTGR